MQEGRNSTLRSDVKFATCPFIEVFQSYREAPCEGGATRTHIISAVSAIARDRGLAGFFRGWLPAYMRDARLQESSGLLPAHGFRERS